MIYSNSVHSQKKVYKNHMCPQTESIRHDCFNNSKKCDCVDITTYTVIPKSHYMNIRVKSDFARRFNCIYSFKLLKNLHFGVFETKF